MTPRLAKTFGVPRALGTGLAVVYFFTNVAGVHAAESNFWSDRRRAASLQWGEPDAATPSRGGELYARLPTAPSQGPDLSSLWEQPVHRVSQDLAQPSTGQAAQPADARLLAVAQAVAPYGQVRRVKNAPVTDGPLVLHIQDVHGNLEAQRNMSGMVLALAKKQNPLVGLEGAAGAFDTNSFHAYPDQDIVKSVADFFLEKDLIGGPEHAGVVASKSITLWGVEDPALYLAHVDAVKASLAGRNAAETLTVGWAALMEELKQKHFSSELREYDHNQSLYEQDRRGLGEYVETLKKFQSAAKSAEALPNVEKLLVAARREKTMDFESVENERRSLVEGLATRLSVPELQDLVRRSLDLKSGAIGQRAYQSHLRSLCAKHKLDLSRYPRLIDYMTYVADSETIERDALLDELARLETSAQDALVQTSAQREVVALSRDLSRLKKIFANEMTPADWTAYESRRTEIARIGRRLETLAVGRTVAGPADWNAFIGPYEDFCRKALARNAALADRLLEKMKADRKTTAVLVAGGFHTDGLVDLLAARGATVAVLTPKIGPVDGTDNYLDVFANDPLPVEKIFAGEPIALKAVCGLAGGDLAGDQTARVHAAVAGQTLMGAWEDLRGLGHSARTILRELRERLLALGQEVAGLALIQPHVQAVGVEGLTFSYRAPNGREETVEFRSTDEGVVVTGARKTGPLTWLRGVWAIVSRPRPAREQTPPRVKEVPPAEGSFFQVREIAPGKLAKEVKEVVGPRGDVQYELSEADRERLAQLTVEYADRIRESVSRASGGRVAVSRFERNGRVLFVDKAPGAPRTRETAEDRKTYLDAMRGADNALGLDGLNDPIFTPDGWRIHVDRGSQNLFYAEDGKTVTWIDPVTVWPPADRRVGSAPRVSPLVREWGVAWRESFGFLRPLNFFRAHATWTPAERWVGALLIVGLWGVFGETAVGVFQWTTAIFSLEGGALGAVFAAGVVVGWAVTVPLHAGWNLLAERVNAALARREVVFRLPRLTIQDEMSNEFEAIEANLQTLRNGLIYLEKQKGNPSVRLQVVELYLQTIDRLTRLMADMEKYLPKQNVQKFRSRIFASQDWLPSPGKIINLIELIGRDGNYQTAHGFLGQIGKYTEFVSPLDTARLKDTQTALRQAALQAETQRMKGVRPNGKQVRAIAATLALTKAQEHWLDVYAALEREGLEVSFERMSAVGKRSASEYKRLWEEGLGGILADNWTGGTRSQPGDETLLDDLEAALEIHTEEEPTTDGFLKKWPTAQDFAAQIAKTANVPAPLVGLWLNLEKKGEYARLVKKLTSASPMLITDREGVEWRVMSAPKVFEKMKPTMADTVSRLARKLIELGDAGQTRGAEYSQRGILREKWATSWWIFGKKFDAQKTLMIYWFGSGSEAHAPGDSFAANKEVERKVFENADTYDLNNGVVVMSDLTESRPKPIPAGALPRVVEWLKSRGHDTAAAVRNAPWIESGLFSLAFLVPFALAMAGVDGSAWAVGGVYTLMNAYFGLQHTRAYRSVSGRWVEGPSTGRTKAWLAAVGMVVHLPLLVLALNPLMGPIGMLALYAGGALASVVLHRGYNVIAAKTGWPAATITQDPVEGLLNLGQWGQYESAAVKKGFERLASPEYGLAQKPGVASALFTLFQISARAHFASIEEKRKYLYGVPFEPYNKDEFAARIFDLLETNEEAVIRLGDFFGGFSELNRGEDWVHGLLAKAVSKSGKDFEALVQSLIDSLAEVPAASRPRYNSTLQAYYYSWLMDRAGQPGDPLGWSALWAIDFALRDVGEATNYDDTGLLNVFTHLATSTNPEGSANALLAFLKSAKGWQRGLMGYDWKSFAQMVAQQPVKAGPSTNPMDTFLRLRELLVEEDEDRRFRGVGDEAVASVFFITTIFPEIRDEILTGLVALNEKLGTEALAYTLTREVDRAVISIARGEYRSIDKEIAGVPGMRLMIDRYKSLAEMKIPTADLRFLEGLAPNEIAALSTLELKEEPERRWERHNEFMGFAVRAIRRVVQNAMDSGGDRSGAFQTALEKLRGVAAKWSGGNEGSLLNETEKELTQRIGPAGGTDFLLYLAEKNRVATIGLLNEALKTYPGGVMGRDPFFDFFKGADKNVDYVRVVEHFYRWTLLLKLNPRGELRPFVDALSRVDVDWSLGKTKSKVLAKTIEPIVASAEKDAVVRYFGEEFKSVVDTLDQRRLTQLVVATSLAASLKPEFANEEDPTVLVERLTETTKEWLRGYAETGTTAGADRSARSHADLIPGNSEEKQRLLELGYSPRLWEEGVNVEPQEVRPMTEEARKAQIRRHTEQLVDLAFSLGLVDGERRAAVEATLFDYETASKFVQDTFTSNQERLIERFSREAVEDPYKRYAQLELHLTEMLVTLKTLSVAQKLAPDARGRVSIRIQKNFLDEMSAGHRIPGCFNPFGGAHREMPVVHALETGSMFAMAYNEETGEMIANVVLALTDDGVLVFGDYNSSGFDLSPVWQEAWKKMALLTPGVVLTPTSAGRRDSEAISEVFGGQTLRKGWNLIADAYFDFGVTNPKLQNSEFFLTEAVRMTESTLARPTAPRAPPVGGEPLGPTVPVRPVIPTPVMGPSVVAKESPLPETPFYRWTYNQVSKGQVVMNGMFPIEILHVSNLPTHLKGTAERWPGQTYFLLNRQANQNPLRPLEEKDEVFYSVPGEIERVLPQMAQASLDPFFGAPLFSISREGDEITVVPLTEAVSFKILTGKEVVTLRWPTRTETPTAPPAAQEGMAHSWAPPQDVISRLSINAVVDLELKKTEGGFTLRRLSQARQTPEVEFDADESAFFEVSPAQVQVLPQLAEVVKEPSGGRVFLTVRMVDGKFIAEKGAPEDTLTVRSEGKLVRLTPPVGAMPGVVRWLQGRGLDIAGAIRRAPLIESGLFSLAFLVPFALTAMGAEGATGAAGAVYALMNAYFGLQHRSVYRFENGGWVEGPSTWRTKVWLAGVGAVIHLPLLLAAVSPAVGVWGYVLGAGLGVGLHRLYNTFAGRVGWAAATLPLVSSGISLESQIPGGGALKTSIPPEKVRLAPHSSLYLVHWLVENRFNAIRAAMAEIVSHSTGEEKIALFKKLAPENIKTIDVSFYAAGSEQNTHKKYVYKLTIEPKDGKGVSILVPLALKRGVARGVGGTLENDETFNEIRRMKVLSDLDTKRGLRLSERRVPISGGFVQVGQSYDGAHDRFNFDLITPTNPSGEGVSTYYVHFQEFIEGGTVRESRAKRNYSAENLKSAVKNTLSVWSDMRQAFPQDAYLWLMDINPDNFMFRRNSSGVKDPNAVLVDLGLKFRRSGDPALSASEQKVNPTGQNPFAGQRPSVFVAEAIRHLGVGQSSDVIFEAIVEHFGPKDGLIFLKTVTGLDSPDQDRLESFILKTSRQITRAPPISAGGPSGATPPVGAIPGVVDWLRARGLSTAAAVRHAPWIESGAFSVAFFAVLTLAMAGVDGGSWAASGVYGLMNAYFGYKHDTVFRFQNGNWVETRATWKTRLGLAGVGFAIHAPLLLSAWSAPFVGGLWFAVLYPFLAAASVQAHRWYNEQAKERGWAAATVGRGEVPPVVGEGSFFTVTDVGNGILRKEVKEYVGPPQRLYRLNESEREKAAALVVDYTNRIRRVVNEQLRVRDPEGLRNKNFVPLLRREGRFIYVDKVDGLPFNEAVGSMTEEMAEEARRDIRGAVRAASDVFDLKYDQMLPLEDGWRIGVDNKTDNFLFAASGDLNGWIDAISPWPPESHRVEPPSPPSRGTPGAVEVNYDGRVPRVAGWTSPLERTALTDLQKQVAALLRALPSIREETRNGYKREVLDDRGAKWPTSFRGRENEAYVFEIPSNGKNYWVKVAFGLGVAQLANEAAGAAPATGIPGVREMVDFRINESPLQFSYVAVEAPRGQPVGQVMLPATNDPLETRAAVAARIESIPVEHVRAAHETVRLLAERGVTATPALTRYDAQFGFVFEGLWNEADPLRQMAAEWFPDTVSPGRAADEVVARVLSAVTGLYPGQSNPYYFAARERVASAVAGQRATDRRISETLVESLRRAWREQIDALRPGNLFPAGFSARQVGQSALVMVGLLTATVDALAASVGAVLGGKAVALAHSLSFAGVAAAFAGGWRILTTMAGGVPTVDTLRTDEVSVNPFGWRIDTESEAIAERLGLKEDLSRLLLGGSSRPVWLGFKDLRRTYRPGVSLPTADSQAAFRAHLADMARWAGREEGGLVAGLWGVNANDVFRAAALRRGQSWGGITLSRLALAELVLATSTPFQRALPWFHGSVRWALRTESSYLERGHSRSQADRLVRAARAVAVLRAAGFSLTAPTTALNQEVSQEQDRRLILNAAGVGRVDVALVEDAYNATLEKIGATNLWLNAGTAAFVRLAGGRAFHREGIPAGGPTGTLYFNIDALVRPDAATEEQRGKVAESLEGVLAALSGEYLRDRLVLTTSASGVDADPAALSARLTREFGPSFRALQDLMVLNETNASALYQNGSLRLSVLADHAKGRGTGDFELWTHDAKNVLRDRPGLDKILVVDILDVAAKFDRMLRQMRFLATNA